MGITYDAIAKVNGDIKTTNIKGKDYAEVNQRINAFRKLCPDGSIETSIDCIDNDSVVMTAVIKDAEGRVLATGHAYELQSSSNVNKTSYVENCETSAVGRALGFLGLGCAASIATAEEVKQQALQEQAANDMVQKLLDFCKKDGIDPNALASKYNKESINEMALKDIGQCIRQWAKVVKVFKPEPATEPEQPLK